MTPHFGHPHPDRWALELRRDPWARSGRGGEADIPSWAPSPNADPSACEGHTAQNRPSSTYMFRMQLTWDGQKARVISVTRDSWLVFRAPPPLGLRGGGAERRRAGGTSGGGGGVGGGRTAQRCRCLWRSGTFPRKSEVRSRRGSAPRGRGPQGKDSAARTDGRTDTVKPHQG